MSGPVCTSDFTGTDLLSYSQTQTLHQGCLLPLSGSFMASKFQT